jgi:hypothetical protein
LLLHAITITYYYYYGYYHLFNIIHSIHDQSLVLDY